LAAFYTLVDARGSFVYTIHMKRTNLVLDEKLLEEATRLSGEKTYSAVVERALEDFVRRIKAHRILDLRGSGLWEGDLAAMRSDRPKGKRPR
jgi:Arc/MetJ family transcription regulator